MITTSDNLRSYLPSTRQCYFEGERYLHYFTAYTQRNCELECFTNYTLQECGCTMFNMPSGFGKKSTIPIFFALIRFRKKQ
jgi:acid-sensing ion channel, other